ncbi:hypothetical protein C8R45DRAFT_926400 [Mycena sanguinolenta]|nr:hypothetical protein C8R45DRAFT_926400 [Mycena sanguinolenta]
MTRARESIAMRDFPEQAKTALKLSPKELQTKDYPADIKSVRPTSSYAPSSFGGESVRRRVTRRNARRVQSAYEEEEEGYASGGPARIGGFERTSLGVSFTGPASGEDFDVPFELIKIRVKLHYDDDIRGMALAPETPFEELMDKVTAGGSRSSLLKFTDEDGGKVSLRDGSDYELAIETARESSKGKPEGKLEIWCMDA